MRTRTWAVSLAAVTVLAACADDSSQTGSAPELDLATLQAEGPEGTYDAGRIEQTQVGEVDQGLFIGVVVDRDEVAEGQQIRAYVCNGADVSHWLAGEVDSSGSATLIPEMLLLEDDPDIRVELDIDDLAGNVFVDDEDGEPFTVAPATGDAGIYTAEETFDENTARASWIVLPDGRQVGGGCEVVRCGRNPRTGDRICFCVKQK